MNKKISKAEQELREKIAQELCRQMGEDAWENLPLERPVGKASYLGIYKNQFYELADPILAYVKQALPELAKEAGYKSPPRKLRGLGL